jgi:clorobiocin biosynthesis protein CloN4
MAVGEGADARLVAFVAPQPGRDPGVLALKRHITRYLPRYMVADEVQLLSRLPRNDNGKIDRPALAARAGRPEKAVHEPA